MREIKFRAWSKLSEKGHWVHPEQIRLYLNGKLECHVWDSEWTNESSGVELMQFTGLQDKYGKDIYEGDIVKWNAFAARGVETKPKDWFGVVDFKNAAFFSKAKNEYENCGESSVHGFNFEYCEIIGNIYENPELLK